MQATDKNRSLFLKGFGLSRDGNYEDPTYLGFKFVFDFGGLPVDDLGIPPSPLFKDGNYTYDNASFFAGNPFRQPQYNYKNGGVGGVAYYSAQRYLEEREFDFDQSNPISRLDLFGANIKIPALDAINKGGKRADMLRQFKVLLQNINKNSPWFFQSISGLDKLITVARGDYNAAEDDGFNPQRTEGKYIDVNCLESFNLRISALADLYREATFDYEYMRELLPRNLRYFKMFIFVTEIRNINKTARLSGSASAVKALQDVSSLLGSNMNPGTKNALDQVQGGINKVFPGGSSPGGSFNSFVGDLAQQSGISTSFDVLSEASDQSGIKPVMIFECSQCEFDFDGSYPFKETIDNGTQSASAATQSFRIHVGRVRVKNQYPNIRLDGAPLVLADGWDSFRSSVQKVPRFGEDLGNDLLGIAQDIGTNFVSQAIGDMITEGVANLASSATGQPVQVFDSVYNFSTSQDSLEKINQYFSGSSPQNSGFGGPPQRNYVNPSGDSYPEVPGKDLGVPDRIYNAPSGDAYPDVPGKDLGVPDRIYNAPAGDFYPDVPGKDLGVPDRIYNTPAGDVYPEVPGKDLGVPDRMYTNPAGDFYPDVPGKDLGVPDRKYPQPSGDAYTGNPGPDLGPPQRIYKTFDDSVYPESLGNTSTSRNSGTGEDLNSKLYPEVPEKSSAEFSSPPTKVYPNVVTKKAAPRGAISDVYPSTNGDFIVKPPIDLGDAKPEDKFNISLGAFNPPKTDFE